MAADTRNDFSKGSIPKAIWGLALPMTAAQLINILYSIVDRMYLGHIPDVGRLSLTGLGICLPIISIVIGFANLCGMGGAPLCSIHRGKGEEAEAERIMGNSFTLLLLFGVVITAVFLAVKEPMLYLFGASDATFPYANDYLTIYLIGTISVMIGLGLNPFINSQGFGRTGMMTVLLGAVVNIVLDPIFIFIFDMGVRGAALATILAQTCSAVWVLFFLTGKRAILRLRLSAMRLSLGRVKRILALGVSGFIMALTNSLVQVLCNASLQAYGGDLYVGVMTVINSVREVVSMPISGFGNGLQPVLGFNFGAGKYTRVREGIRYGTKIIMLYTCVSWAVIMLLPDLFIHIFNSEEALLAAGVPAMRMYFAGFFVFGLQMTGQSTFVGLGKAKQASFFAIFRKVIVLTPFLLLLPNFIGVDGVFWAESISQVLGGAACFATMYLSVYRPLEHLPDVDATT